MLSKDNIEIEGINTDHVNHVMTIHYRLVTLKGKEDFLKVRKVNNNFVFESDLIPTLNLSEEDENEAYHMIFTYARRWEQSLKRG